MSKEQDEYEDQLKYLIGELKYDLLITEIRLKSVDNKLSQATAKGFKDLVTISEQKKEIESLKEEIGSLEIQNKAINQEREQLEEIIRIHGDKVCSLENQLRSRDNVIVEMENQLQESENNEEEKTEELICGCGCLCSDSMTTPTEVEVEVTPSSIGLEAFASDSQKEAEEDYNEQQRQANDDYLNEQTTEEEPSDYGSNEKRYDSVMSMVEDTCEPKFVEEFRQLLTVKKDSSEWQYAAILEQVIERLRLNMKALIEMLSEEYKEANPNETVIPDFITMAHALRTKGDK